MIALVHLKIFKNYNGDGDMLVRQGSDTEKEILNYDNWRTIEGLLMDIRMVKRGLTSKKFSDDLLKRLNDECDSELTITELRSLAEDAKLS